MTARGLQARVALQRGALSLEVELVVPPGDVVVLLGPNAVGKTTLLHALAGLLAIERGRIELDGVVLDDPVADVFVPPERRSVGMMFQEYLLFPHLSAVDNVAFGLRARGLSRRESRDAAAAWLDRVGMRGCGHARPRTLSGGQAQRVALARALAPAPRLLLLDEPLAAVDAGSREELREELIRHLASFAGTCLVVTHDSAEAVALADQLIVLEHGHVTQAGTREEVLEHPASRYVKEVAGLVS